MPTASPIEPRGGARLPALDALRGVAILLVLMHHMSFPPPTRPWPLPSVYHLIQDAGWIGVDLFFVLSGFLVSGLLFREYQRCGEVGLKRFLVRRGLKIYPAFYLMLGFTILVRLTFPEALPLKATVTEALFLQNYGRGLWAHTWSLAVEEHFYLLLAFALYFASRRRSPTNPFRPLLVVAPAMAVLALAGRFLTLRHDPAAFRSVLQPTHLRIDSLLCGVVLSYLHHFDGARLAAWVRRHRLALAVCSLALLLPAFALDSHRSVFMRSLGVTFLYLGFGGVLLLSLQGPHKAPTWTRFPLGLLAALGGYSYSIYLWHLPARQWLDPLLSRHLGLGWTFPGRQLTYLGECLVLGVVMARLVEAPVLALRDRYFPSRELLSKAGEE